MKYNFKTILERLDFWREKSRKWDKAFEDLSKVISPSSYATIIEDSFAEGFIDGVSTYNKELGEDLRAYLYDDWLGEETKDGKKYDFTKKKDVLAYFNDTYND